MTSEVASFTVDIIAPILSETAVSQVVIGLLVFVIAWSLFLLIVKGRE